MGATPRQLTARNRLTDTEKTGLDSRQDRIDGFRSFLRQDCKEYEQHELEKRCAKRSALAGVAG
jgi:hypothetical protein